MNTTQRSLRSSLKLISSKRYLWKNGLPSPFRRLRSNANGFTSVNWLRILLMRDTAAGAAMADTCSMAACLEVGTTVGLLRLIDGGAIPIALIVAETACKHPSISTKLSQGSSGRIWLALRRFLRLTTRLRAFSMPSRETYAGSLARVHTS